MNFDHDHHMSDKPPSLWKTRFSIGLLVLGGVAGYFLLTEHLAHLAGALPYLLLLSCPLMHLFMHHGHGGHDHHHRGPDQPPRGDSSGVPREPRDPGNPGSNGSQGGW